jgi:hypothetical protein
VLVVPSSDSERSVLDEKSWAYLVTLPGDTRPSEERPKPQSAPELIDLLKKQSSSIRANGIWLIVSDERAEDAGLRDSLKELRRLSSQEEIPFFMCLGSQFPWGWDRMH